MQLTGLGKASKLHHLWQAPFNLHSHVIKAIEQEAKHAAEGKPAKIIAKLNQLTEPKVITALYAASQAGVTIDLIVRGVCTLRPGLAELSENIRVRSILGRFLEHTRIYYFHNNKQADVYLSSADWMERNFFRRIEVAVPILCEKAKRRVVNEGLMPYLKDNCQTWEMSPDGEYKRKAKRHGKTHCAQESLIAELAKQR